MNIKDLTVDQLRRLQLKMFHEETHQQTKVRLQNELIPFPSLAVCLATVSKEIGFIIQVKYPSRDSNGRPEIANYFDEDTVVDSIINIVFNDYDQRKIIFTSSQCDICVLLQKKQNRFPVLLQTQAVSSLQDGCYDFRSLETTLEFAVAEKLLGVFLPSVEVARDKNLVTGVHKMGLVLFAGGPESCSPDIRKLLCRSRVNGLETCHINFDVVPGSDTPHFNLPTAHVQMLYIADIVLNKGLMRLPRCSVADSSNCDYRQSLVMSNEMDQHESKLTI
ncbi:Glycerophosphocholine phosphodiesterase gpcpd1 [Bulinus truncatus]|nr:Glycerophosphocholine phosphodiesterase gpcpd1 [Bulinus truncatus]